MKDGGMKWFAQSCTQADSPAGLWTHSLLVGPTVLRPHQKLFPCNPKRCPKPEQSSWIFPDYLTHRNHEKEQTYYFKPLIWGWFGPFSTPQLSHSVPSAQYTLLFFFPFHYFFTRFNHLSRRPSLGYSSSMQTSPNASVLGLTPYITPRGTYHPFYSSALSRWMAFIITVFLCSFSYPSSGTKSFLAIPWDQ